MHTGGLTWFFIPSIPAARHSAITRYGFAAPSGLLSTTRPPSEPIDDSLINGLASVVDHTAVTGARYPGTSLLYELTIGLVISDMPAICLSIPAIKQYPFSLMPNLSSLSVKIFLPSLLSKNI